MLNYEDFDGIDDIDNVDIENNEFGDYGDAFMPDVVHPTREALIQWVREVGYSQGFVMKISKSDHGGMYNRERVTLVCERSGVYKPLKKVLKYVTSSKKCNCPFKLYAKPCSIGEGWTLNVKCGKHNHEKHESMVGHPYPGRLTEEQQSLVINMTKDGVKPVRIMNNLKELYPSNCTTIGQIYNFREQWRRDVRRPRTQMQHLLNLLTEHGYESWHRTVGGTDVLDEIFWAHPTSITLLQKFKIVLIMDNTYKSNRYKMPLMEIVGQTSTGKTFSAAFCYMACEKYDNFVWALQKLKRLIGDVEDTPRVIVTDFDGALVKAIGDVFPTSKHLLCQFHIKCNVKAKLKVYARDLDEVPSITKAWLNVVHCRNENEYQSCVDYLEEKSKECVGFMEYVHRTYLDDNKEKFVDVWVNRVMHLGNTTTNRVESAHATFKRTLSDNRGDIATCFESMHRMVTSQHVDILASFQISIVRVEHRVNNAFFKELNHFVSKFSLGLIFQQLSTCGNDQSCDCSIRTTHGLPCSCELPLYKRTGRCIPLEAIQPHWRKLSLIQEDKHEDNDDKVFDPEPIFEEFRRQLNLSDISGKMKLMSKIREVVWPDTTSMIPPKEMVKTKGRCSLKEESLKRDVSYWEHVETKLSSQNMSTTQDSINKLSEPVKLSKEFRQKRPNCFKFPSALNDHIKSVCDVDVDGNCGFRSLALFRSGNQEDYMIVRYELIQEMKLHAGLYKKILGNQIYDKTLDALHFNNIGHASSAKWLDLPDMGHVIATRYNVALVSIHHEHIWGCATYLPYIKLPESPLRIWAIGNVSGVHWVQVILRSGSPLPPVYVGWKTHCSEDAKVWETQLQHRCDLFRTFLPKKSLDESIINIIED